MDHLIRAHRTFPHFESEVLFLDPRGRWFEAAEAQRRITELAVSLGEVTNSHFRVFEDLGIVHGLLESRTEGRTRCTAIYNRRGADWFPVQLQYTSLAPGAALELRHSDPPIHDPWIGLEPVGTEDEVLQELNAAYVQAFRDADVAWYDTHLAADYVVINGNGTMDDRGQALTEFAKPVFRDHIARFPVDKVRVRRFGGAAIIDAENAYVMKDGRTGVNRYVDIWHRQAAGHWRCLAAQITPVLDKE